MKASRWILLAVAVVLLAIASIVWFASHRGAGVAEKYKAELRAKGEKLSFAELGFPRQPENGEGLVRLTNAVAQIQPGGFFPGLLSPMHFVGPGRAQVCWRASEAPINNGGGPTNKMSWDEVTKCLDGATDPLAEIRSAVEQPVRWFLYDPASYLKNRANWPLQPFISMRTAAQWLSADTIGALHVGERDRALKDLHALVQLTEFGKEDSMLVAQMIHVAISGLGLSVTWEALQNADWTEPELTAMQRDWEHVDLLKALETGFLGERAFGEARFADIRENGAQRTIQRTPIPTASNSSLFGSLQDYFAAFVWRMNAEEDELLVFQSYQTALDSMRDLQKGKSWPEVQVRQQRLIAEIDKLVGGSMGLRKYQFLFSATIIPNVLKASQTVVKNETQRRLTITAIALKRFELEHHRLPASLPELAPEFFAAVPIDLMSGQPLRYRLNADGSFLLYSVGEDGRDDGGDPNPPQPVSQPDLWSGRDAVWPAPAVAPQRANN